MLHEEGVTVGLLRPPCAAPSEFLLDIAEDDRDMSDTRDREAIDERIDEMRMLFEEATQRLGLLLHITEYQLFCHEGRLMLPRHARARAIHDNHILASIDPSPDEYQFIAGSSGHPLRRSVVAYTDSNALLDTASLHATQRVPLVRVDHGREECVQRIFVLHLPLNGNELIDSFQKNMNIVKSAVEYPFGDTNVLSIPSWERVEFDEDHPLATPEGAAFLRSDIS